LYLKQANERAEQRLLSVETLAAVCALRTGGRFPREDFAFAWRELLKCYPHDSICGCSCDEVHRDMLVRYASLHGTLEILTPHALVRTPLLVYRDPAGAQRIVRWYSSETPPALSGSARP
jgi:Alpha mannosidase middle domain